MLLYRHNSGHISSQAGMLNPISLRDRLMDGIYPMRFFDGNPSDLVDITHGENPTDTMVIHYNFNQEGENVYDLSMREKDTIALYRKMEQENRQKGGHRSIFTFNKRTMAPVTIDDFERYYPNTTYEYTAFVYDTEFEKGGFPNIFVVSRTFASPDGPHTFSVQAVASQVVAKSHKPTPFGKQFTYLLLKANGGEFSDFCPDVNNLPIPENSVLDIPRVYNTTLLEEVVAKSGASELIATSSGTQYLLPAPNPFGEDSLEEKTSLALKMQRQVLDKSSIQLLDMVNLGIGETIRSLVSMGKKIDIEIDIPDAATKMCILAGFVYIVPHQNNFDWENFFSESGYFIGATEETYPKNP